MRPSPIFISYRRIDTGPIALALRSELEMRLNGPSLFLDVSRIEGGDAFAAVIDDALEKARVLLALIGDQWTGDDGLQRRIDDERDWVHHEISRALRHAPDTVIPVLVNGARLPPRDLLPAELTSLLDRHAIPLRLDSWEADLRSLCELLSRKFNAPLRADGKLLPEPSAIKRYLDPLSDQRLDAARLDGRLPGWRVTTVHDQFGTGAMRENLTKQYRFASPRDAFAFVAEIEPLTLNQKHHPAVELIFKTVSIDLSTWDAGHRITIFDLQMAMALDGLRKRFAR